MIFEFINPSDPYHFEADNFEVATVATFILGEGAGAAHEIDSQRDVSELFNVPIFLFGGEEKWVKMTFNMTLSDLLGHVKKEHKNELVKCLESFTIGSFEDYIEFKKVMVDIPTLEERNSYKLKYHKSKLTSMNDFGRYAWAFARGLKKSED